LPPLPLKPPKLNPGATICLVAPASAVADVPSYEKGKRLLVSRGFRIVEGRHVRNRKLLFAGGDRERAADINNAFKDRAIDAIICVQGGTGAARTLPYIDFDCIARNPKIFVGYSDITVLQLAMLQRCGLITFYGPMAATEFGQAFTSFTDEHFFQSVTTTEEDMLLRNTRGRRILTLCGGEAKGQLVGGCLSVFVSLLGTEWEVDTKDKVLFFEDVNERPHRIERYLTQLFLANKLQVASAILFGAFTRCEYTERNEHGEGHVRTLDVVRDHVLPLKKPCLYGLQFGHVRNKLTLPNGGYAFINATKKNVVVKPSVSCIGAD
jgi:muramoyltetrapeptide carboxypeptidase